MWPFRKDTTETARLRSDLASARVVHAAQKALINQATAECERLESEVRRLITELISRDKQIEDLTHKLSLARAENAGYRDALFGDRRLLNPKAN